MHARAVRCTRHDDDNSGLWTSLTVAAEAFRYLVTGDPAALETTRVFFRGMQVTVWMPSHTFGQQIFMFPSPATSNPPNFVWCTCVMTLSATGGNTEPELGDGY
jgi:hypothetical protein